MSKYDDYSRYNLLSPYYDDAPNSSEPQMSFFGSVVLTLLLIALGLALVWGYVGPIFYTVFYVLDFIIHLFDPNWPVKWMGDSSPYTIVVSGLTALALAYGVYRLFRLFWRIVQFIREG
jgi:hypothetical protein